MVVNINPRDLLSGIKQSDTFATAMASVSADFNVSTSSKFDQQVELEHRRKQQSRSSSEPLMGEWIRI